MDEVLKQRLEAQRRAAIGDRAISESQVPDNANDIFRRSFEHYATEHREQQGQVAQTRRERAMRYWNDAKTNEEK